MKARLRSAARWALGLACALVAFWAICVVIYLAIVLFIFSAAIALIRGAVR